MGSGGGLAGLVVGRRERAIERGISREREARREWGTWWLGGGGVVVAGVRGCWWWWSNDGM